MSVNCVVCGKFKADAAFSTEPFAKGECCPECYDTVIAMLKSQLNPEDIKNCRFTFIHSEEDEKKKDEEIFNELAWKRGFTISDNCYYYKGCIPTFDLWATLRSGKFMGTDKPSLKISKPISIAVINYENKDTKEEITEMKIDVYNGKYD